MKPVPMKPVPMKPVQVMGNYWTEDASARTPLGELVSLAKDSADERALAEVSRDFAAWAGAQGIRPGLTVVSVPASPDRSAAFPRRLVAAIVDVLDGVDGGALIGRRFATVRIRDVPPAERLKIAEEAGYYASTELAEKDVLLIDDVIVTGTTLLHVAAKIREAGARSVTMLAVARSQRAA